MKLPRFVFLTNPTAGVSDVILETLPPFFMGKVYGIPKRDTEKVEQMLSDIANERTTAVKMEGFTIFLTPAGSLNGSIVQKPEAIAKLRDMAVFYRDNGFEKKNHRHRQYQEGVPDDIDRINGGKIKEAKAEGRKIFLDQK